MQVNRVAKIVVLDPPAIEKLKALKEKARLAQQGALVLQDEFTKEVSTTAVRFWEGAHEFTRAHPITGFEKIEFIDGYLVFLK
jgi:hypothetical protein